MPEPAATQALVDTIAQLRQENDRLLSGASVAPVEDRCPCMRCDCEDRYCHHCGHVRTVPRTCALCVFWSTPHRRATPDGFRAPCRVPPVAPCETAADFTCGNWRRNDA